MARTPEKNFLRAWREFRGMTQAQLAESVGTTGAVISLLESGQRGLSDKWLRRLSPVLETTPGHLLDLDPDDASSDIFEIWNNVPEESRAQAKVVLQTFTRGASHAAPPGGSSVAASLVPAVRSGRSPRKSPPVDDLDKPEESNGGASGKGPKGI